MQDIKRYKNVVHLCYICTDIIASKLLQLLKIHNNNTEGTLQSYENIQNYYLFIQIAFVSKKKITANRWLWSLHKK